MITNQTWSDVVELLRCAADLLLTYRTKPGSALCDAQLFGCDWSNTVFNLAYDCAYNCREGTPIDPNKLCEWTHEENAVAFLEAAAQIEETL